MKDCTGVANAAGSHPESIEKCYCVTGYYWSNSQSACVSCTVDNVNKFYTSTDAVTSAPSGLSMYEICNCAIGVMSWNSTTEDCEMDCGTMANSVGSVSSL